MSDLPVDSRWMQFMLDSADFTIISTDIEGVIRSCNHRALERLGYKSEELIGIHTPVTIHDRDEIELKAKQLSVELGENIEPGFDVFVAKARLGVADENEWSYICKDGSFFTVLLSVTALKDDDGRIEGYLGIGRDISLRKAMEYQINQQQDELLQANKELTEANVRLEKTVRIDPLTQLLNRRGFLACFEQEIERIKRQPSDLSIMMMDIDHFKLYNDELGHIEGDLLLKKLSSMMKEHARSNDCIARFGGEEFLFVLPNTDVSLSMKIAERYRVLVKEMKVSNKPITASYGVTTLSAIDKNMGISQIYDQLLKEADKAMYASKAAGRNCVTHFSSI